MRPSVLAALPVFTKSLEGRVGWLYLDTEANVTCAQGNLIPSLAACLALPWQNLDGSSASEAQITAAWNTILANPWLAQAGALSAEHFTTVRLSDAAMDGLLMKACQDIEAIVRLWFPVWDDLPADCQLGIVSMGYAMGGGFPRTYPRFTRAVNAGDWQTAARECAMNDNPPPVRRNAANAAAFLWCEKAADPAVLLSRVPPL